VEVALLPSFKSYLPFLAGARGTMVILASCATPALNARIKKILSPANLMLGLETLFSMQITG
jgi:hypothetical protein